MALFYLTKKAAAMYGLDVRRASTQNEVSTEQEDWIIDTIWPQENTRPGILFYHRATGFVIPLSPEEYRLEYCLSLVLNMLNGLLTEHGLEKKMSYLEKLFSRGYLCRNSDQRATGYISKSKMLINGWLDKHTENRVDNSYDLMKKINCDYRNINGEYNNTRIQDFLSYITTISDQTGISHPVEDDPYGMLH